MEQLLDYFTPWHYRLELCFWRDQARAQGKVEITGKILTNRVKLHAVNLDISSVEWRPSWNGYETPSNNYGYMPCEFSYNQSTLEIVITPAMQQIIAECDEYEEESITLKINYTFSLKHNLEGCYLSSYDYCGQPQTLITTQFESHYARQAFPCVDEPAAKATFDLVLIVPDWTVRDVVLANTSVIQQTNGRFEFATTPKMSTYLLAWVIGPLKSMSTVNQNGVRVTTYCALNQPESTLTFANETAAKALDYYDKIYDLPYPLDKLDQVALPDFEAGAMENWGLVTYRESCLLAEPNASLDSKRSVAITVTHELAHQWFGDLVTMRWWDDLWLNEAFASIMEYCTTDVLYPELEIWQDFFTGDCVAALRRDAIPGVQAVQQAVHHPEEIATLFDGAIVYAKGARLVLMLMRLLGEENFYRGMHDYFVKHQYGNTIGDDLWQALQPYADFDVKDFMHAWISQPGYPAIRDGVERRFLIDGSKDDETWPLPEIFDDMSGHYLLDLTDAEFTKKLESFATLSDEQKLRLLIDRMLLAKTVEVPSSSLLDLLPKFVDEDASSVWGILISIINDLKLFCPPDTWAAENYKLYLRKLLARHFQHLDLTKLQDANQLRLRAMLLGLAYYVEDDRILHQLADLYREDLAQIDAELLDFVLLAKMFFNEATIFPQLLVQYSKVSDPEIKSTILYILTMAKQPEHLAEMIDLLKRPDIVRPQDHIFLYAYLLRNHRSRAKVLDWVTQNWDHVKQITGDKSIEDYVRYTAGAIRTDAEAQKFYDFFDPLASNPILTRAIKTAHVEIDARLRLIAADTPGVEAKLKELVKGGK